MLNGSARSFKGRDVRLGALWLCVQLLQGFLPEPAPQKDCDTNFQALLLKKKKKKVPCKVEIMVGV